MGEGLRTSKRRVMVAAVCALAIAASSCTPAQRPPTRRQIALQKARVEALKRSSAEAEAARARAAAWSPGSEPVSDVDPHPGSARRGTHTIQSRLAEFGPRSRERWRSHFQAARVAYPAWHVVLVVLKHEKVVEVYAGPASWDLSWIRSIDITAASGGPGPKLREGDRQVPEGIYQVDKLNPNSAYHVSMRLAYPNAFDERMARGDGRHRLGGLIMIHGSNKSIGCVAVGNQAAEDLFVLAADAGLARMSVMIVPRDFRRTKEAEPTRGQPAWVRDLYANLATKLRSLPAAGRPRQAVSRERGGVSLQ